jgi:hypothetical protein
LVQAVVEIYGRYYEGLFVICPLELKREFDQLDLTEGERNECDWNSPSRKAYGRNERAVHGVRAEPDHVSTASAIRADLNVGDSQSPKDKKGPIGNGFFFVEPN